MSVAPDLPVLPSIVTVYKKSQWNQRGSYLHRHMSHILLAGRGATEIHQHCHSTESRLEERSRDLRQPNRLSDLLFASFAFYFRRHHVVQEVAFFIISVVEMTTPGRLPRFKSVHGVSRTLEVRSPLPRLLDHRTSLLYRMTASRSARPSSAGWLVVRLPVLHQETCTTRAKS